MKIPNISLSRRQLIIVGGAVGILVLLVIVVMLNVQEGVGPSVTLTFWGTEPREVFEGVIGAYRARRPNVEITYQSFAPRDYEARVISALASGRGPDILMLGNRDLPRLREVLSPVPSEQFSRARLASLFPTVVEQDFVAVDGNVYALPLYIDTLALIYNKDTFDRAGIATPPVSWEEFRALIPRLRVLSATGQIAEAGAAIGGSEKSVTHAVDILHLLMLQNGTEMTDRESATRRQGEIPRATFARGGDRGIGFQAFQFYVDFANAGSSFYTWNDAQLESLESFASGKTAMVFAYHDELEGLARRSPFLRAGVSPVPQVFTDRPVHYAEYQGLAVSAQSRASAWAWDFILFAASDTRGAERYFDATARPPALRNLISEHANDEGLEIFTRQALTARSWYIPDSERVLDIFDIAIQDVLSGKASAQVALRQAEDQVNQLR